MLCWCCRFFYFMHGKDLGTLNVYQRNMSGAGRDSLVFTRTGEQGTDWKLAAITLEISDYFAVSIDLRRTFAVKRPE